MKTSSLARTLALLALLPGFIACEAGEGRTDSRSASPTATLTAAHEEALGDTLRGLIARAYSFSDSNVVSQLMSLYPDSGPVVSASSGRITSSRDSVEAGVRWFWENIGRNMRGPHFTWGPTRVDVLSPDAAVLTGTYSIPHRTPVGAPHVVGGAWTAVFERRDGRWVIVHEHLSDAAPAQ